MNSKCKVSGIFMAGCNQDAATGGFVLYQPGHPFKKVPIFLSSGTTDTISSPEQHATTKQSMERSGFTNVRLETYQGGQQLNAEHLKTALKWFRSFCSK